MSFTPKYAIGDLVLRGPNGKVPHEVVELPPYSSGSYRLRNTNRNCYEYEHESYLVPYETSETIMTQTLYSFSKADGTVAFGTHIGTNSQNKFLIEEKVSGEIHILDKSELEEVLPYTFSAKVGNNENHYIGTPDVLKVGDILLCTSTSTPQIAVVTAVDTKNKNAKKFKGAKIVTVEI